MIHNLRITRQNLLHSCARLCVYRLYIVNTIVDWLPIEMRFLVELDLVDTVQVVNIKFNYSVFVQFQPFSLDKIKNLTVSTKPFRYTCAQPHNL